MLANLLQQRFGPEWEALASEYQRLVLADFHELCRDEYDADDPLNIAAADSAHDASYEYRRRIGGGNLQAYADCLAASKTRGGDQ